MTLQIRKAGDRGRTRTPWLDSYHTFSFGEYYDPQWTGFHTLRVMNDDYVGPARGFGMHGHRDMEIITCVLEGELEHRDSLGTGSVIRPGEVQRMTAGTGILHSEMNPSPTQRVHLLQIWITPSARGLRPGYEQKVLPAARPGVARLAASPDGAEGSLMIHQNAKMWIVDADASNPCRLDVGPAAGVFVHAIDGPIICNDRELGAGDALCGTGVASLQFQSTGTGAALVFELL